MNAIECFKKGIFYLDGGTGSCLQEMGLNPGELPEMWNIERPEEIIELHKAYYTAGSDAVCTNTFGANGLKFDGKDGRPFVSEIVEAAVLCAKKARASLGDDVNQRRRFIALDIGPLGRLLEPMGDLPFETAVELFAEVVRAGAGAGVDFVLIEMMNDSYETKAALLAAKENCNLPVFVSNVYDAEKKLMSGTPPEAMVAMLEGMGADVIGLNCSLGPDKMLEVLPDFINCASVPILVKPNAGIPRTENGNTVYDVSAKEFAEVMKKIAEGGASVLGGCCGTTPDYIQSLVLATHGTSVLPIVPKHRSVISSYTNVVEFGKQPILIGERINPTGKKRFKQALVENDIGYILKEGINQQDQGVHVLDVNVGLPEIDEPKMLEQCIKELQGVCNLPLQIDTSNPKAMEKAMRVYNGKPMVNSVNGSEESMSAVFPLVKKYGGVVVCLTLDEKGIPDTAEGRLTIAKKIVNRAADYGINVSDLIFDPLALTISSDSNAACVTLETIPLIKAELGACCSLGVSNISFGLPNRDFITSSFFTMALAKGLGAAIVNPFSNEIQKVYHSFLALSGLDANCQGYIEYAGNIKVQENISSDNNKKIELDKSDSGLKYAIIKGFVKESAQLAKEILLDTEPLILINEQIIPALDVMGKGFEKKTVYLPQLLMSAEAAKAAFEEAKRKMPTNKDRGDTIVLATVKGDIHDIGKNIVKALLENYGYCVVDLGKDVAPEVVLEAVIQNDAKVVGLSALMTTTVPAMADTIHIIKKHCPDVKVIVGGAVLTNEYADMIGADSYSSNAMGCVRYAESVFKTIK